MDSNTKWRAIEILANDSSRFSADLREMKKLHDQLQKFQGVWSNTQDTVSTMNSLSSYKEHIERTEGRIVNIVIDGASVPYDIPDKKKA
ncbi:hypothetical protein SAMN05660337_3299 [Maridesulfovibrio ferrireducens]|uniref:Uncharacterized protein n=1 Tax=Maridesulfovibrio ferrireducens TaxID=246191 RepID=A0A1G9L710_9BACT|nr:hypothetical protein [Maridesulfovibrio ferrireducens]SDL57537.1 hypothetical protein SAMN05660337_3299 [Maridesulfovibrio ferrireducens]